MSLKTKIEDDIKSAMKNKEERKRDLLRLLKGEIERTYSANALTDGDVVRATKKLIKTIQEEPGDTTADQEILSVYLPKPFTAEEIEAMILKLKEDEGYSTPKDMGKVMSYFKTNFDGQYDGKLLSDIVKNLLR